MSRCEQIVARGAAPIVAGVAHRVMAGLLLTTAWLTVMMSFARADDAAARAEITAALNQWTTDFNASRADKTCALFSRELRADYRGLPERGYDRQCEILKQSLSDPARGYSYTLAIKEILVSGDTAVVRLTWTLTVRPKDGKAITTNEPGLDVFRKESDGRWRIVRYMAYEE